MKVCVYAICKNESQFVERWMASMGEADAVVVLDTGSTDDTVERLRAAGAVSFVAQGITGACRPARGACVRARGRLRRGYRG